MSGRLPTCVFGVHWKLESWKLETRNCSWRPMTYKTCNHLYDTGGVCNSAAVTDRDYCAFHLRYRARQLRSAQARARMERFDLRLPPIESMASVLSAINQLVEAVAADMIDLKRADFLLKSLRFAAQALKSADKWLPSVYHSDVAAPGHRSRRRIRPPRRPRPQHSSRSRFPAD